MSDAARIEASDFSYQDHLYLHTLDDPSTKLFDNLHLLREEKYLISD